VRKSSRNSHHTEIEQAAVFGRAVGIVAGHATDAVFRTGEDAERAVAKFLHVQLGVENGFVEPDRALQAGRGDFEPVGFRLHDVLLGMPHGMEAILRAPS